MFMPGRFGNMGATHTEDDQTTTHDIHLPPSPDQNEPIKSGPAKKVRVKKHNRDRNNSANVLI